jgi:pyrroloquinoline quinone (PQQ) biosynthesis protein C
MTTATLSPPLSRSDFEAELDQDIRKRHPFLHHRFPQMLIAGELSMDHLRGFGLEFEHFLRAAPRHFFCLGANAPDVIPGPVDIRHNFAENLNDDMGIANPPSDHFQIFRRFAYAIDLTQEQLENHRALPSTTAFNLALMHMAKDLPYWEGIAAISWANESLFALGLTDEWHNALQKHYGLRSDQIFLPPAEEETEHVQMPRTVVLDHAESARMQQRVRDVLDTVYDLWTVFFDGLYNTYVRPA